MIDELCAGSLGSFTAALLGAVLFAWVVVPWRSSWLSCLSSLLVLRLVEETEAAELLFPVLWCSLAFQEVLFWLLLCAKLRTTKSKTATNIWNDFMFVVWPDGRRKIALYYDPKCGRAGGKNFCPRVTGRD